MERGIRLTVYMNPDDPIELPINGVLDLHTFHPRDMKDLVTDYLNACMDRGIFDVRIIHGKGMGVQRRKLHSILSRIPEVVSHRTADLDGGSWGATLVKLASVKKE